jgi:hypothetical protein
MQAYRAWDDRTHERLVTSRWTPVVLLAFVWTCLLILPFVCWQVRATMGRASPELLVVGFAFSRLVGMFVPIGVHRSLRRRQAEERRRAGLCDRCGYVLRDSYYYCPECGQSLHW